MRVVPTNSRRWLVGVLLMLGVGARAVEESYKPWEHLWYGARDFSDSHVEIILGAGLAATVLSLPLDKHVQNYFAGKHRLGGTEVIGNKVVGTGIAGAAVGVSTLVYGEIRHRREPIDAGQAHLEALFTNVLLTSLVKVSVQRKRPDTTEHNSFPSGHTSTAFTSAASLQQFYGWAAGGPALALAAFTGLSRMAVNRHHLSDVVFGATLGYATGYAYSLHHLSTASETVAMAWMPYFDDRQSFGIELSSRFF